tara:strand:+ start:526 stop:918 length:393 start_codon:yes stop_codon:yes gene_type:complete
MNDKFKTIPFSLFALILLICSTLFFINAGVLYATESNDSILMKKVSQSYTKKFCNSIGFGLSKESAMNFSLKENNQVFNKRKDFNRIDKELLAEEIAIAVVRKCGYPINLSGEKGVEQFKSYYLSKDQES